MTSNLMTISKHANNSSTTSAMSFDSSRLMASIALFSASTACASSLFNVTIPGGSMSTSAPPAIVPTTSTSGGAGAGIASTIRPWCVVGVPFPCIAFLSFPSAAPFCARARRSSGLALSRNSPVSSTAPRIFSASSECVIISPEIARNGTKARGRRPLSVTPSMDVFNLFALSKNAAVAASSSPPSGDPCLVL